MSYDEQPDGDPHGECAAEIHALQEKLEAANKKGHEAVLLAMKHEDAARRANAEVFRLAELLKLKRILKRQYEDGYDSACDTLEETIVELERLRATVVSLQDENSHLRAMNRRMCGALAEYAPIQGIDPRGRYFYERMGDGGQNPVVTPTKPPAYKYPETFCSQCGGEFGPGNEGFSHCENHKHLPRIG